MSTSSIQCHRKLILVPSHRPLDTMVNIYGGHVFDLKTRVDIWMRIDLVPVE